jgi:AraC-like DNA-binding protein
MRDVKTQLYLTVHGSKKSVEQIADECGISASYLYRAVSETENGCRFPLDMLIPLMRSTNDYRVLDRLNAICDRTTLSHPRVRALKRKKAQTEVLHEIEANFHEAMKLFYGFWIQPDSARRAELLDALHRHECDVRAMQAAVRTSDQGDLF